jgi:L-aminopeptidase/D-esterase-like protein
MRNDTITAIDGICVGHAALPGTLSGCTVVLPPDGATAGVDIRGGAPGTYGTDTLYPLNLVDQIHGLFFTGGSAFGLSVSDGLRNYLKESSVGFNSGHGRIPIVAGAVIFDLGLMQTERYPDGALGYEACLSASRDPVREGNEGAGLGGSVGKIHGMSRAMKSGLGSACIVAPSGLRVGALMVVNAYGDVVDPCSGKIIAGCRAGVDSLQLIDSDRELVRMGQLRGFPIGNTIVGVVATNAKLNKTQLTKVAQMAHAGLTRTVYPAHTQFDGDTIFAMSCGELEGVDLSTVGTMAARGTAEAILRGVRKAAPAGGLPSFSNLLEHGIL